MIRLASGKGGGVIKKKKKKKRLECSAIVVSKAILTNLKKKIENFAVRFSGWKQKL